MSCESRPLMVSMLTGLEQRTTPRGLPLHKLASLRIDRRSSSPFRSGQKPQRNRLQRWLEKAWGVLSTQTPLVGAPSGGAVAPRARINWPLEAVQYACAEECSA